MKITLVDERQPKLALPHQTKQDSPRQFQIDSSKEWVFFYSEKVKTNAQERVQRVQSSLKWIMKKRRWFKKMLVCTFWSDWRYENKSHEWLKSNVDLLVVVDKSINILNPEEVNLSVRTPQQLARIVRANVSFVIDDLEVKDTEEDSMVLCNNNPNLVFPTIIWDSLNLWGNRNIFEKLKSLVSEEIVANPKLCQSFAKRLTYHKKVLSDWNVVFKWKALSYHDLEKQLLFYNPKNDNEWLKLWPLRVIQYSLALALMRKIRNLWYHPLFIDFMPTNILERLDFLVERNLTRISKNEIEEIKFIYAYFLKLYHQMQFENHFSWTTEFHISRDDKKDIWLMLSYLRDSFLVEDILK